MVSKGTYSLKAVRRALDLILPGCRWQKKTHHWWIYPPDDKPMATLPLGSHGRRESVEIQVGHVRALARQFGIPRLLEILDSER